MRTIIIGMAAKVARAIHHALSTQLGGCCAAARPQSGRRAAAVLATPRSEIAVRKLQRCSATHHPHFHHHHMYADDVR